mmetsp:Transcript_23809/g.42931  ORF Transcript_23809/g.42931 Transcript_23809/m.42931 type:complete len:287 (+) Transcript_23809:2567-3427(+)
MGDARRSVWIPHRRATFEVANGLRGFSNTGADWMAVFVDAGRQITFNAIVDDPVVTAIGVNPDTRLQLAQILAVKATVNRLVRWITVATCGQTKAADQQHGDEFQLCHDTRPLLNADDFDTAVFGHACGSVVGRRRKTLAVTAHVRDARTRLRRNRGNRIGPVQRQAQVIGIARAAVGVTGDDIACRIGALEELSQALLARLVDAVAVGGKKLIRVHHTAQVAPAADRNALAVDVRRHIALGAVIHDPVLTPIGVNPDRRDILPAVTPLLRPCLPKCLRVNADRHQ